MDSEATKAVIALVCGECFESFKRHYDINFHYSLNPFTVANAVQNAATDLVRVAAYQSQTGADAFRHAAYVAKWLAELKPIQVDVKHPVNLNNEKFLNASRINAAFATYFVAVATRDEIVLSDSLLTDLRYCFQFRIASMPAEAMALLLKHQPRRSSS